MARDIRDDLWKEVDLLQSTIGKFDDYSFRIKNWFLTIFAAVTGYAVVSNEQKLLYVNFLLIVIFYLYEITYRTIQWSLLKRNREIQKLLRENDYIPEDSKPPNLDKYLLPSEEEKTPNWFFNVQKKLGLDEERAYRNVYEWRKLPKESVIFLFRFRVSLPYIAAIIGNLIAFLLTCS